MIGDPARGSACVWSVWMGLVRQMCEDTGEELEVRGRAWRVWTVSVWVQGRGSE